MMTRKYWDVLIVDDDDDVHQITELALKREMFFNLPLKLHHARSAAEAKKVIASLQTTRPLSPIAVGIIDVIMETETAGLDLCKYIRTELSNESMQLIVRTGQPGAAPPRMVIDDYNISAYIAKAEVTNDRLYVVVKTALQAFFNMRYLTDYAMFNDATRTNVANSAEGIKRTKELLGLKLPEGEFNVAFDLGSQYFGAGVFEDKSVYDKLKPKLLERASGELKSRKYMGMPNPIAKVDEYVVIHYRPYDRDVDTYMVMRDPTVPRGLYEVYGPVWRRQLMSAFDLVR